MMPRLPLVHGALLINILIPIALIVFGSGFFPYKPFLPGIAQYEDLDLDAPSGAPFDRLIFMVVDALRSDFVYAQESGFQFTQSLIRNGVALPFTANARSPTITMPRLKSMTTGSIPSFVDVILNFDEGGSASTLALQDSWVAQMKAKATGKLLMYGDDTWLKLFPAMFDRVDGTSSFFVSDFTEVDYNVTRHIASELRQQDWSTMVLHYLGLDHIGHKGGPRSVKMLPKQREMDGVVMQIFRAFESLDHLSSTLLVLCGDHGMNDAGNHGASSLGETSPALVFISPKLRQLNRKFEAPVARDDGYQYYSTVEQSDIAPTLGALLGFPVPKNNLGAIIPDFLPFWASPMDQIRLLMRNAKQIMAIMAATFQTPIFEVQHDIAACAEKPSKSLELACLWQQIRRDGHQPASSRSASIYTLIRRSQGLLSSMASNFNVKKLAVGQMLIGLACAMAFYALIPSSSFRIGSLVTITIPYGIMMFGSSYVEEEHHFWYWTTTAWITYLAMKNLRSPSFDIQTFLSYVLALAATRLSRTWNQTGQKYAGKPDAVQNYFKPYPLLLWLLVCLTYTGIYAELVRRAVGVSRLLATAVIGCVVMMAFAFKLSFTAEDAPELVVGFWQTLSNFTSTSSLTTQARGVFSGVALLICLMAYPLLFGQKLSRANRASLMGMTTHIYVLFAVTQSRITNIPLFILLYLQFAFLEQAKLTQEDITISCILLQHMSFFVFGGSNSIASIDLSNAYNGVSGFNVLAVGVLTFASNWVGPIFWTVATSSLLTRRRYAGQEGSLSGHLVGLTLFTACAVASVMAACAVLRTHLFIWTVFSPKYLYCLAWSMGQHLIVDMGLGGFLVWLGSRGL